MGKILSYKLKWIFIDSLIILLLSVNAFGQIRKPDSHAGRPAGGKPEKETKSNPPVPDTVVVRYLYADNPEKQILRKDTGLASSFYQYDPIRSGAGIYGNLGYLGSAMRPLIYEQPEKRGFDIGLHQFDNYYLPATRLRFYNTTLPYSSTYYSQGASKDDAVIKAAFGRTFAKGINLSVDFRRYNNKDTYISRDKILKNAKNTAVAVGIWKHAANDRYDAFLTFAANSARQRDDGGVLSVPDSLVPFVELPIPLADAQTRHGHKELVFTQHLRLNRNKDTTNARKPSLVITHQAAYKTGEYKSYDKAPADSAFYRQLLTDDRGLRQFIKVRKIENSLKLRFFGFMEKDTTANTGSKNLLEAGVLHAAYQIDQEPIDTNINNLMLFGKWRFYPFRRMGIHAYAHIPLWDNRGDYYLKGSLLLDLKKAGRFDVTFINQLYSPDLMQNRNFISQVNVWNNDFKKTLSTGLSAKYSLPELNFEIEGKYQLLSKPVYFDTTATPRQLDKAMSIFQLFVKKNIRLGAFHLDNYFIFQKTTENILSLPSFFTANSLYFQGKLFKEAMLLKTGFEARLISTYFAPEYLPLTGRFYMQEKEELPFTPLVDFFLMFKLTKFRFFVKVENLLPYTNKKYYYLTKGYPLPYGDQGGIRWGLSWQFIN